MTLTGSRHQIILKGRPLRFQRDQWLQGCEDLSASDWLLENGRDPHHHSRFNECALNFFDDRHDVARARYTRPCLPEVGNEAAHYFESDPTIARAAVCKLITRTRTLPRCGFAAAVSNFFSAASVRASPITSCPASSNSRTTAQPMTSRPSRKRA